MEQPILEQQSDRVRQAFFLLLRFIEQETDITTVRIDVLTELIVKADKEIPETTYDTPGKLADWVMRREILPWRRGCIVQFRAWAKSHWDMDLRELEAWDTIRACMDELHPGGLWIMDPSELVARLTGGWVSLNL